MCGKHDISLLNLEPVKIKEENDPDVKRLKGVVDDVQRHHHPDASVHEDEERGVLGDLHVEAIHERWGRGCDPVAPARECHTVAGWCHV